MYSVTDDFLPTEAWQAIHDLATGDRDRGSLPYFIANSVAHPDSDPAMDYYFIHLFYIDNLINSEYYSVLEPLISRIQPRALVRVKANLYPSTHTVREHDPHVDYDFAHSAALYMVNTCNGYTTMSDGTRIESVANRLVRFDPQQLHSSSTTSDSKYRVTINFNYF